MSFFPALRSPNNLQRIRGEEYEKGSCSKPSARACEPRTEPSRLELGYGSGMKPARFGHETGSARFQAPAGLGSVSGSSR